MTTRPTALPSSDLRLRLLLVTTLDARLLQQLAVLLLRHALAALLDDGTHETSSSRSVGRCCGTDAGGARAPRVGDEPACRVLAGAIRRDQQETRHPAGRSRPERDLPHAGSLVGADHPSRRSRRRPPPWR